MLRTRRCKNTSTPEPSSTSRTNTTVAESLAGTGCGGGSFGDGSMGARCSGTTRKSGLSSPAGFRDSITSARYRVSPRRSVALTALHAVVRPGSLGPFPLRQLGVQFPQQLPITLGQLGIVEVQFGSESVSRPAIFLPFSESSAMAARSCATSSGLISVVSATRFSNWASSSAENDFLSGFSSACLAGFGESTDLPDSVDAAGFAGSDETDGDSMYPACPADSASACCGSAADCPHGRPEPRRTRTPARKNVVAPRWHAARIRSAHSPHPQ